MHKLDLLLRFLYEVKDLLNYFQVMSKWKKAKPEQIEIQDTNKTNSTDLIISKEIQECYISEKKLCIY